MTYLMTTVPTLGKCLFAPEYYLRLNDITAEIMLGAAKYFKFYFYGLTIRMKK